MRRNKRGITLIALIITVIVLLILAGVTMSFVVGDNGVVTQSQKAKIRTEEEEAKEEIEIEVVGCYDDDGNIDLGLLNESLKKKGGVSFKKAGEESDFVELKEGEDENNIEELPVTVKYKNVEVEITGEYTGNNTNEPPKGKLASELVPTEDYGKFVDYGLDLGGDGKTTNDWKIFYTDDEGRIFLIAADYVPNNCSTLKTAMDKDHSKMIKNTNTGWSVCCEYWSSSSDFGLPTYHCYDGISPLNKGKEGGQCSFPETFMLNRDPYNNDDTVKNHYFCSSHVGNSEQNGAGGNTNSRCVSSLQCTMNWRPFIDESSKKAYAEKAIGGPTLEMWVASWNQKYGDEKKLYVGESKSDGSGYNIGTSSASTSTSISLSSDSGYSDTLYFPHKNENQNLDLFNDGKNWDNNGSKAEGEDNASCSAYWLASPSDYDSNYVMYVICNGDVSYNNYNFNYVRCSPRSFSTIWGQS